MDDAIMQHCAEIDRCNQRGSRMLSVLDLLDAKTLDLDLAAYLMARIGRGASFIVGANPGGAGKTTVMCALLNFIPPGITLLAASPAAVRQGSARPHCYICHEIGSGNYFAYLWGNDLRAFCSLHESGHQLAANLHADDIDEAYAQIVVDNGVPVTHFNAFELLIFLQVTGIYPDRIRCIAQVCSSNGTESHTLAYDAASGRFAPDTDPAWQSACRGFLETQAREGKRNIEAFREAVVNFLKTHAPAG
jgi:hypothetical protein